MPFRKKPTRDALGLKNIATALEGRVGLYNRVLDKQKYWDGIFDLARNYQNIHGNRINKRILGLMASSYVKGLTHLAEMGPTEYNSHKTKFFSKR